MSGIFFLGPANDQQLRKYCITYHIDDSRVGARKVCYEELFLGIRGEFQAP